MRTYTLGKVIKDNPDYLPALVLLTEVEIASGDYAKAEQNARKIAERFPARGLGPRLMGDLAVARGQFDPAIASYRAALAKENSADTVLRLYRAHVRAGRSRQGLDFHGTVVQGQSGGSGCTPCGCRWSAARRRTWPGHGRTTSVS